MSHSLRPEHETDGVRPSRRPGDVRPASNGRVGTGAWNTAPAGFAEVLAAADRGARVDLAMHLQSLASNRATTDALHLSVQRAPDGLGQQTSEAMDVDGRDQGAELASLGGLVDPIAMLFAKVVASNVAAASPITVPPRYETLLKAYATANSADGAVLSTGLARGPVYYAGGWILDIQKAAKAMTLDTSVFVRGELNLKTYIHEMVHVNQYGSLGPTAFLAGYFGLSAAEIAKRLAMRLPIDPMKASPYEQQAYALEDRFMDWWRAHPAADPASPPASPCPHSAAHRRVQAAGERGA